ncbi:hypothetical protein [Methyloversatilis sp.]|uniref:hypothetical protein n=1 Tax=Methyloversatilis sp. TaxID=2569862 RepID=UPI0035ADC42A
MSAPSHRPSATDVAFKTTAGRREMVERALGLTALERTLLVITDGRQDFAALFAVLGHAGKSFPEGEAAAARLLSLGLLECRPTATVAGRRSLALARLYLIEAMERALRGRTSDLMPQLRAATDEASLLGTLRLCERLLVEAGAGRQAAAIRQRCLELLPEPGISPTEPRAAKDR